jgi:hypothetical protein
MALARPNANALRAAKEQFLDEECQGMIHGSLSRHLDRALEADLSVLASTKDTNPLAVLFENKMGSLFRVCLALLSLCIWELTKCRRESKELRNPGSANEKWCLL